jgi:hypothetical protein
MPFRRQQHVSSSHHANKNKPKHHQPHGLNHTRPSTRRLDEEESDEFELEDHSEDADSEGEHGAVEDADVKIEGDDVKDNAVDVEGYSEWHTTKGNHRIPSVDKHGRRMPKKKSFDDEELFTDKDPFKAFRMESTDEDSSDSSQSTSSATKSNSKMSPVHTSQGYNAAFPLQESNHPAEIDIFEGIPLVKENEELEEGELVEEQDLHNNHSPFVKLATERNSRKSRMSESEEVSDNESVQFPPKNRDQTKTQARQLMMAAMDSERLQSMKFPPIDERRNQLLRKQSFQRKEAMLLQLQREQEENAHHQHDSKVSEKMQNRRDDRLSQKELHAKEALNANILRTMDVIDVIKKRYANYDEALHDQKTTGKFSFPFKHDSAKSGEMSTSSTPSGQEHPKKHKQEVAVLAQSITSTATSFLPSPIHDTPVDVDPIAAIVGKIEQNVVAISVGKGLPFATGLVIHPQLILTARHSIEGSNVTELIVRANFQKQPEGSIDFWSHLAVIGIVEESLDFDYTILLLHLPVQNFSDLKLHLTSFDFHAATQAANAAVSHATAFAATAKAAANMAVQSVKFGPNYDTSMLNGVLDSDKSNAPNQDTAHSTIVNADLTSTASTVSAADSLAEALSAALTDNLASESAVFFHHPYGWTKKVSVHVPLDSNCFSFRKNPVHHTDFNSNFKGSSGGVYVNARGEVIALHTLANHHCSSAYPIQHFTEGISTKEHFARHHSVVSDYNEESSCPNMEVTNEKLDCKKYPPHLRHTTANFLHNIYTVSSVLSYLYDKDGNYLHKDLPDFSQIGMLLHLLIFIFCSIDHLTILYNFFHPCYST